MHFRFILTMLYVVGCMFGLFVGLTSHNWPLLICGFVFVVGVLLLIFRFDTLAFIAGVIAALIIWTQVK